MLAAGFLLLLLGAVLLLHSSLPLAVRIAGLPLWLWEGGRSIAAQGRAFAAVRGLRIACNGEVDVLLRGAEVHRTRLLGGSRVGPALAWLRVEWVDGRRYGELLRAPDERPDGWRRLQVAWRWGRARQ